MAEVQDLNNTPLDANDKLLQTWDDGEILKSLSKLPCPMTWELDLLVEEYIEDKSKQTDWIASIFEEPKLPLFRIIDSLLSYAMVMYKTDQCEKGLEIFKQVLNEEKVGERTEEKYPNEYQNQIYCIMNSCCGWFYYKLNSKEECCERLRKAELAFNSIGHADSYFDVAKAITMEKFSLKGMKLALAAHNKFLKQNDIPLVHFYVGSLMGRIRRRVIFTRNPPSHVELKHLEMAYEGGIYWCGPKLIKCYLDSCKRVMGFEKTVFMRKGENLIRKLISEDLERMRCHDIAVLLFSSVCCNLDMENYYDKLNKAAEHAIKGRPESVLVNDYVARYYLNYKNYTKALSCLEIVSVALSYTVGIHLHVTLIVNPEADFENLIEKLKNCYTYNSDLFKMHGGISEFYLLSKRNEIIKCCDHFLKMCTYGSSDDLKKYFLTISFWKVRLIDVLYQVLQSDTKDDEAVIKANSLLRNLLNRFPKTVSMKDIYSKII